MIVLIRASIRVRLTLWYVFLLAVILAAFSAGVYLFLRHTLYQNLDESIQNHASALVETIQYEGTRPLLLNAGSSSDPNRRERFARVFDSSGDLSDDNSSATVSIPVNRAVIDSALAGESTSHQVRTGQDDDPIRAKAFPIRRDGKIVGVLEVGQSEEDISETLAILLLIMGIAYPITLVVAGFGGIFLAGRALSPIDKITRTASHISGEDLSQRLNLQLPEDEVGRLARTFDEMISRLDDAFRRQRQFTACCRSTILSVGNCSGKMSVYGRTDIEYERAEPVTYLERSIRAALDDEGGGPAAWSK